MDSNSQHSGKREIVVNSDWLSALGIAFLLLFSLLMAVLDCRNVLRGHLQPVSFDTVILALCGFAIAASPKLGRTVKAGAIAVGIGAAIRALAYYLHASAGTQQLAGINELVFSTFAYVMFIIAAVQWFRRVVRLKGQDSSKDATES